MQSSRARCPLDTSWIGNRSFAHYAPLRTAIRAERGYLFGILERIWAKNGDLDAGLFGEDFNM